MQSCSFPLHVSYRKSTLSRFQVKYNRILVMSILSIWSWSLLQFTMVLTATKARRDQSQCVDKPSSGSNGGCCRPDVYGIIVSILMQDAPFLVLRMLLIIHYGVVSYTNMFFTCKNTLVIALLMYRLIVVNAEQRKLRQAQPAGGAAADAGADPFSMSESNSKSKLMNSDPYYNSFNHSDSKVRLREPVDDPNERPVQYIIKRHISDPDLRDLKGPDNNVKRLDVESGTAGMMTPKIALRLLAETEPPPYGMYAESEYTQSEYDNTEDFSSCV